jgi:(1->4)-alpha-D-glucan 1-alpha-D-glucosylmutase
LIGAWPLSGRDKTFTRRVQEFAVKAMREAKLETSWINANTDYENRVLDFIAAILSEEASPDFVASFAEFVQRPCMLGALNSMTQLTLKCTLPGVPDFYQGTELWDFAMVDPDNRRAVDFAVRQDLLGKAGNPPDWADLAGRWTDGQIKLAWMAHLLALRQAAPELFAHGDFQPLPVHGRHRDHVIAYARRHRGRAVVVVACRKFAALTDGGRHWPDLRRIEAQLDLDGLTLDEASSDRDKLDLAEALASLPVATFAATMNA